MLSERFTAAQECRKGKFRGREGLADVRLVKRPEIPQPRASAIRGAFYPGIPQSGPWDVIGL